MTRHSHPVAKVFFNRSQTINDTYMSTFSSFCDIND